MAKFSRDDKFRIQTLREQGLGAKAIKKCYPDKSWSLRTINRICNRVDRTGSAVERKKGSGRPKSARTAQNIQQVDELICSQEGKPGSHKSTRRVAAQLGISRESVRRIAKRDLGLSCFKRIPGQVINEATRVKRLTRCKQLLKRFTVPRAKRLFFTDEKTFYLDPPVNSSRCRVWAAGRKRDVSCERLVRQRTKFSRNVMVSAGICHSGKGGIHFVPEKVKVNAKCYTEELLPLLIDDCHTLLGNDFVFQQDGAPAHTARQAQEWLQLNCPDFIGKDQWPPNSPDLNPLDYCIWGLMLDQYEQLATKPTTTDELRAVLQYIWNNLPQQTVQKAVKSFHKRLQACVRAEGRHFEHLLS